MDLDFSASSLAASFLFGVIGLFLFKKGKSESQFDWLIIGIILMIYPMFTKGPLSDWGIGTALCALAYFRPFT